jgi:hypothetical protein
MNAYSELRSGVDLRMALFSQSFLSNQNMETPFAVDYKNCARPDLKFGQTFFTSRCINAMRCLHPVSESNPLAAFFSSSILNP